MLIILSRGIAPSNLAQEPTTDAARTDSSDNEWRNRETVKPPLENARSTSVELAVESLIRI